MITIDKAIQEASKTFMQSVLLCGLEEYHNAIDIADVWICYGINLIMSYEHNHTDEDIDAEVLLSAQQLNQFALWFTKQKMLARAYGCVFWGNIFAAYVNGTDEEKEMAVSEVEDFGQSSADMIGFVKLEEEAA